MVQQHSSHEVEIFITNTKFPCKSAMKRLENWTVLPNFYQIFKLPAGSIPVAYFFNEVCRACNPFS